MNKNLFVRAAEFFRKQRLQKRWQKVVGFLAVIVVFVTTYALILPAITMERQLICSAEEHTHDSACYVPEQILTCELEESEGHTHGAECSVDNRTLICTLEETEGHTHSAECTVTEKVLICEQETTETAPETAEVTENLEPAQTSEVTAAPETIEQIEAAEPSENVEIPEVVMHEHNEECYIEQTTQVCQLEEVQAHTHTEACYEGAIEMICPLEECEGHAHEEETCFQTEQKFVCEKEEHIHVEECYLVSGSDPEADVETAEIWEATLADAVLTGDWEDDMIAIAKTQLGYRESEKNYVLDAEGEQYGYSRYGAWYGDPYGNWCAMFVSFCMNYAGVEGFPLESVCQNWIDILSSEEYGLYHTAEGCMPEAGNLIFFDQNLDGTSDHVGIVTGVSAETEEDPAQVLTIEGNTSDSVMEKSYALTDETILGYGKLPLQKAEIVVEEGQIVIPEEISEEDRERILKANELAAVLPTTEEFENKLAAYEEAGDEEGYLAYWQETADWAKAAYAYWQMLGEELQQYVTDAWKIMDLISLWEMAALTNESTNTVEVYEVNSYSLSTGNANPARPIVVSGDSVSGTLGGEQFKWWRAYVIEQAAGVYYVAEIDLNRSETASKGAYASESGFVLLVHDTPEQINASVGDTVTVNFDYTNTKSYIGTAIGSITFTPAATVSKTAKDHSAELTTTPSADTRDLITINLYDYGENINDLYTTDAKYPVFQQNKGQNNVTATYHSDFGDNITEDLEAGIAGVTGRDESLGINRVETNDGANRPISGEMYAELVNGYPALKDQTSLSYLFTDGTYAKKLNTQNISGLFKYNAVTGEYSFNSRENHAQFDSNTDTFTLYDQLITSNFIMYPFGNFLPLNDIRTETQQVSVIDRDYLQTILQSALWRYQHGQGAQGEDVENEYLRLAEALDDWMELMDDKYPSGWAAADAINEYFDYWVNTEVNFSQGDSLLGKIYSIDYDEPTDFYFGMEMSMKFTQPKGGMTGVNNAEPMNFYFTGDDDVWVYIDNKLFLDLSGIHRHVGGEIDFVNGEVRYYALDVATGDVSDELYAYQTFEQILGSTTDLNENGTFTDYSEHTFKFYYMERGSGSGVCRMNFNFPLLRTIAVEKELSADVALLGNPDFKFQVLKEDGTFFLNRVKLTRSLTAAVRREISSVPELLERTEYLP